MALLQKMGWKLGTGLGKNNEGSLEPLKLDIKTDRKGLTSQEEHSKKGRGHHGGKGHGGGAGGGGGGIVTHDLSSKHPVSALMELCNKRRWGPPDFQLVHESGPDHKKHFLFKVIINGNSYQPSVASNNKKMAKASTAAACLQELGLIPRT
ncbi:Protein SON [Mizuhopecten yessoensis]|uniref:Protein SON n=2 Tax=Mizuhopecten yessoensis TaxID=6573 RepID=A0A210R492_MIZYE|nr:Protein SON [Mizuhopecten yessoensis]